MPSSSGDGKEKGLPALVGPGPVMDSDGPTRKGPPHSYLHLMTETDPVSETL
jgi:hypothetical protein